MYIFQMRRYPKLPGELSSWRSKNLEKSLALGDEMDGHIVQGHVDGVAEIVKIEQDGESSRFTFRVKSDLIKYIAPRVRWLWMEHHSQSIM